VNPYGWVFRPIIRPFANFIVRILLWMHDTMKVGYGWVLILFGILVRVVLWPLNQAMRRRLAQPSSPEPKHPDRYKNTPEAPAEMKVRSRVNWRCLPPDPHGAVRAFFVFITPRVPGSRSSGPDLSRADLFYIIHVRGRLMFGWSWQQRAAAEPQAMIIQP
jgi:hypothetical protein